MKILFCHDTKDVKDFEVIITDKVYNAIKQYLVQYHLKHPKDVEFVMNEEGE